MQVEPELSHPYISLWRVVFIFGLSESTTTYVYLSPSGNIRCYSEKDVAVMFWSSELKEYDYKRLKYD